MPRPPIERTVSGVPRVTLFKPAGVPVRDLEQLRLGVDELEALRLVDLEGLTHEQAAEVMGVSRQTVGRVLERGRTRVAEALVGGKAILIDGGQYRVEPRRMRCHACQARWTTTGDETATACPECGATDVGLCWGPGDGRGGRGRGRGPGREPCESGRGPGRGGGRGQGPGGRHGSRA
ncbi:MAG TPA: DUF134 domain-containing protein [Thermoleophilia bacterium]|nr:DUF134 domain-containing protein [Actinomycetota bacterium]HOU27950.1 DUF134 domain-containing protein [Thermoleophilia bacterium]